MTSKLLKRFGKVDIMKLLDQFIASISFAAKKVISWKKQSVWKSFFYVIVLVLLANLVTSGYALYKGEAQSLTAQIAALPDFEIKDGRLDWQGEQRIVVLPQIETMIVFGGNEQSYATTQGIKNVIALEENQWSVGRAGFPGKNETYESLLKLLDNKDSTFDKEDAVEWSKEIAPKISLFAPLYQYTGVAMDLLVQLGLISLLAVAGLSYRKHVKISYREAWTITAYGISAPILARTFLSLLGFNMSFLFVLYWAVVGYFSIHCIRSIQKEE